MDLTTADGMGRPWDFSKADRKAEAKRRLRKQKPDLLIGSPMCTLYSAWQRLNKDRDIKAFRKRLRDAREHLEFVCELYLEQAKAGRLFLHEHPDSASSWSEECICKVLSTKGVDTVVSDQCQLASRAARETPSVSPLGGCPTVPRSSKH